MQSSGQGERPGFIRKLFSCLNHVTVCKYSNLKGLAKIYFFLFPIL